MLEKIITSRMRIKLLQLFLSHKTNKYYQRQLEKILKVNIRPLQVELDNLLNIKLLKKLKDGNRVYYYLDNDFPLLTELQNFIMKGTFLAGKLKNILSKKDVSFAFIYGSAAETDLLEASDIDLFIVGKTDPYELHQAIKNIEGKFSRVINYVVYDQKELLDKFVKRDGFITDVLSGAKIFVKGGENDLRGVIKS